MEFAVADGITRNEIFHALNENSECVGFIQVLPKGAFHSFPYLHIIAVKEKHRGKGIGKELLRRFEEMCDKKKCFLLVADFNPSAKRLYESVGYRQIGKIPDLYKNGVAEYLMMKQI